MTEIISLLKKYNNFKYAQVRSIEQFPDNSKTLTLAILDDDEEDLNIVEIEFSNVQNSRILQNSVLGFLDMSSGISIIKENNLYGFALGSGTAMLHVHNAPLFIVAADIKIQEK